MNMNMNMNSIKTTVSSNDQDILNVSETIEKSVGSMQSSLNEIYYTVDVSSSLGRELQKLKRETYIKQSNDFFVMCEKNIEVHQRNIGRAELKTTQIVQNQEQDNKKEINTDRSEKVTLKEVPIKSYGDEIERAIVKDALARCTITPIDNWSIPPTENTTQNCDSFNVVAATDYNADSQHQETVGTTSSSEISVDNTSQENSMNSLQSTEVESVKASCVAEVPEKTMNICFYAKTETNLVRDIVKELKTRIQEKLFKGNLTSYTDVKQNCSAAQMTGLKTPPFTKEINFKTTSSSEEADQAQKLIIVCVNVSRLGTDVENSIGSLKKHHDFLAIIHYKDEHALPMQQTSRIIHGGKFAEHYANNKHRVGDCGFLTGKGFYPCQLNDTFFKNLAHYLLEEES